MKAIRSRAYLDGARGESCKLRIGGVCTGDAETVVAAHIRDAHTGRSIKASDISVVDACWACHEVFDGRATHPISGCYLEPFTWLFYALRGLQETLENRIERGILVLPIDTPKAAKPSTKKIASRGFTEQHRPLRSGNNLRRKSP